MAARRVAPNYLTRNDAFSSASESLRVFLLTRNGLSQQERTNIAKHNNDDEDDRDIEWKWPRPVS